MYTTFFEFQGFQILAYFFSQLNQLLSYHQFCDFQLNERLKTYLGPCCHLGPVLSWWIVNLQKTDIFCSKL